MKQRLFYLGLALVLALVAMVPSPALAAKPVVFQADGNIDYISPGIVFEAGNSGRWIVAERQLSGVLAGDISGDYTLTYRGTVESVETQAGNFHGRLEVADGAYVINVVGSNESIQFQGMVEIYPGVWVPVLRITMGGNWAFLSGANGQGNFTGWAEFIPDAEGHVSMITDSSFSLTGQWQP